MIFGLHPITAGFLAFFFLLLVSAAVMWWPRKRRRDWGPIPTITDLRGRQILHLARTRLRENDLPDELPDAGELSDHEDMLCGCRRSGPVNEDCPMHGRNHEFRA